MHAENLHIDFEALAGKYLAGEASEDEIRLLEEWVKQNEANRRRFLAYKKTWQLSRPEKPVDVDAAWRKLEPALQQESRLIDFPKKRNSWQLVFRIAAAVLLLVAVGFVLLNIFGKHETTLTAQDTIITETLPDGSTITLNRGAELSYSGDYNKEKRIVRLDGDGFFEVTPDQEKPFIVKSKDIEVEVLGTKFYVNSGKLGETANVAVSFGKVSVSSGTTGSVVLTQGEQAVFDREKQTLKKQETINRNILAWKTGKLVFEDENLGRVVQLIEDLYRIEVELSDPELKKCRITASFDNIPADTVLSIISETLGIDLIKKDGIFVLQGEECR